MSKKLFGIDYILGGNYLETLDHHPEGWAAGFLWNVDGVRGSKRAIEKVAASGKCPRIRVSLVWKDDHKFTERDAKIARKRARKLKTIVGEYPSIEWYVQPFLEPKSRELEEITAGSISRILPTAKIVTTSPAVFSNATEVHHSYRISNIFSYDGLDYRENRDFIRIANDFETFFLWQSECNGQSYKDYKEGKKISRPERKDWLKPKHIRQMVKAVEGV